MSERRLHLVESFVPDPVQADAPARIVPEQIALLHEWRAAQIARSKAMHPSTLARAATPLRPLG